MSVSAKKKKPVSIKNQRRNIILLLFIIFGTVVIAVFLTIQYSLDSRSQAITPRTIKLGTFDVFPTILSTVSVSPAVRASAGQAYCIDDEDPDGCDDASGIYVKRGTGGVAGNGECGTVIEQSHKIVGSLPQDIKALRDRLNPAITNCGYSTGTYSSGYISTFFVIDAYNLAGINDLSKNNPLYIRGTDLLNWWKSAAGHTFVNYTGGAQLQQDLTGQVMFISVSSGVHTGVVNSIEVDGNGNGYIAILQSGARFYLDRFEIVNWNIVNTPLHQTRINSVAGFGGH